MKEIAEHPLTRQFWRKQGRQCSENHSMTENDFDYVVELDETRRILLREIETSYYDSSTRTTQTLEGRWEPARIQPGEVILRLSGIDGKNTSVEKFLLVTGRDISYGAWDAWIEKRLKDDRVRKLLVIDRAEAAGHGLPPLRLVADIDGLELVPRLFPDAGSYATLSGTNDARIFFGVYPLRTAVPDAAALEALVRERSGAEPQFTCGPSCTTELQLSERRAQLYFTGTGKDAMAHAAVAIPDSKLLFVLSMRKSPWPEKDFDAIAGQSTFVQILRTLAWDTAPRS